MVRTSAGGVTLGPSAAQIAENNRRFFVAQPLPPVSVAASAAANNTSANSSAVIDLTDEEEGKQLLLLRSISVCANRGRVYDLSFFDYLSQFCFLLIEFHCNFSISYKILIFCLLLLYFD